MKKYSIAIFASGNGTNAEKIIRYFHNHQSIDIVVVLSNNPDAFALERARNLNIKAVSFSKEEFNDGSVVHQLHRLGVTHVVLAGFLWLIPKNLIERYPDRIINLHPALLPKFGGKGMYGLRVHEAVKQAGEVETGITIHVVNDRYDEGKVLFQKSCPVTANQSPQQIAACVHELEYEYYPKVIEQWILGAG